MKTKHLQRMEISANVKSRIRETMQIRTQELNREGYQIRIFHLNHQLRWTRPSRHHQ
jgi:hypothetical protein